MVRKPLPDLCGERGAAKAIQIMMAARSCLSSDSEDDEAKAGDGGASEGACVRAVIVSRESGARATRSSST